MSAEWQEYWNDQAGDFGNWRAQETDPPLTDEDLERWADDSLSDVLAERGYFDSDISAVEFDAFADVPLRDCRVESC